MTESAPIRSLSELRTRATEALRAGRLAEARPLYAAYLAQVPGDAAIWSNLGALLRSEGQHVLALRAQERAFELDPDGQIVRGNLANILSDLGEYDRAIALRRALLEEAPDDANQKALIGKALRGLGRLDEGIDWLTRAVAQHPDFAEMRIQLALTQLMAGRYRDGFANYAARWETGELTPRKIARPQWDGGSLEGKRILVLPEQGFGDAVAFARFLPVLRRFNPARVLFLSEKPLARLLSGMDGADWAGPEIADPESFDVWTNVMDLPTIHFRESETIPAPTRLVVPEDSAERARAIVAPHKGRFRIGVVWCGSVTYRGNAFRSFSHTEFHSLLDVPGVQLFSLYKGPKLVEFHADGTSTLIVDTASTDRDFADCAAMMREMDLIITSDTATAHIAGSLGVPVWVLLHWDSFWLWRREVPVTPWYPSMRLFRQPAPRDWAGVFARVRRKLALDVEKWRKDRADG